LKKAVRQYLERYAEAEISFAEFLGTFEHSIVLPVRCEAATCLSGLDAGWKPDTLLIVVVNGDAEDSQESHRQNRDFLAEAEAQMESSQKLEGALVGVVGGRSLLLIDRASASRRLPPRAGVGLARKIGADIALALVAADKLRSGWIHSTDADVTLPAGYPASLNPDAVAATYAFEHQPSGEAIVDEATRIYEATLRHYVDGLRWAGSAYAFQTVGSAIAFRADAYAAVRGFPVRAGGEDFYLLNKLAKLGPVQQLEAPALDIRARASERVPFGTGPAVGRIASLLAEGNAPTTYDPRCFGRLRGWLERLAEICQTGVVDLDGLPKSVVQHLEELGTVDKLELLFAQHRTDDTRQRAAQGWFDGFRTLKFIHYVQAAEFPAKDWSAAVDVAPWQCYRPNSGSPQGW